ncbi:MAG: SRPBCC domain-containing protein [Microbacteriaceae bacterium]|nr:SRPBCC domain-containing protein [Microbacteriaceae bacterium]
MTTPEARVRRTLNADRPTVWRHLVEPGLLDRWFCPNPELELAVAADPRVGGEYRADMGGEYVAVGEYTEVVPESLLAFTWGWMPEPEPATHVAISLAEADGGDTDLELVHAGFTDPEAAEGHRDGWERSLDRLVELVG